jgi:multiple sugar transport system permease protein/raffinose/stachyose/melibiose transport system permease protein
LPPLIFLTPAALLFIIFFVYPLLDAIRISFTSLKMQAGEVQQVYVGLKHYRNILLLDTDFRVGFKNNFIWAFVSCVVELSMGLALAVILNRRIRFARFFRNAWFSPMVLSGVVVGTLWAWIYHPDIGIINAVLRLVGLGDLARPWIGLDSTTLWAMIIITTWFYTGFNMVLSLAGITGIPEELLEAARIDGTSEWQNVRHIVMPLLRPVLVTEWILCFSGKLKMFDIPFVLGVGAKPSGETVVTYLYRRAFQWGTIDLGYATAVAVLWSVVILAVSLIWSRALHSREPLEY